MDLETAILAATAPILAAFSEWKNPVSDEIIRRQAAHTINEQGLAPNPGQATAIENAMFGVARGAASVSGLLPTIIAFVTTAVAVINDLPQRFWWADGIIIFASLAAIVMIRALGTTTFFGLATDPAVAAGLTAAARRRWWRCWDRLAGNTGTGAERISAWIYLFNCILLGLIVLNLLITARPTVAVDPHESGQTGPIQTIAKATAELKERVDDQAAEIDKERAQIEGLARRVSQFENMARPGSRVPKAAPAIK